MAFSDLTFKLYTDSNLTTPFSGLYQLVHNTDLSDNPQDFVLYLGSNTASRQLQAVSSPGVDNITLTPTLLLSAWAAATAYILGDVVHPTTPNGYRYVVVTAGTSHATTEPTWPTVIGSQVADNTVVWECVAATHPATEIKLALTSGGLAGATGGAALSLGNTILSTVAEAVEIDIRITNTVTTPGTNVGLAELSIYINDVVETAV